MTKKNVLIIGFGVDINRTEAVSKNTLKHISLLKELGYKVYLYNIGASNPYFDTGDGFLQAILKREKIINNLDELIKEKKITHILDIFVLPLSSLLFTLPLKHNTQVSFIKEIHNDSGFSKKIHIETFIRILTNNKFILNKILNSFNTIFTKNLELSVRYKLKFIPTYIQVYSSKRKINKKLNICYLGHPLKKKGIFELLKLLSIIPDKYKNKFVFNIAFSDVGPRNKIEQLFKERALENDIKLNFFQTVQPREFFRQNDVYILPIQDEYGAISTPNTILEAMEASTLVIANDIKSLEGLVEDGKNILLLKDNSAAEILKTLSPVLDDSKSFKNVADNGRKLVIKSHNKELILKKIESLYE